MTTFLSRLDAHSKFMGQMMERCGIDPVDMAQDRLGVTLMQAARACIACGRTQSCKRWLDAADQENIQEPPSFCPNAQRFRHAQEQR
jgi:Family of unknown function (DUF6455)